jgi:hypothetical protein
MAQKGGADDQQDHFHCDNPREHLTTSNRSCGASLTPDAAPALISLKSLIGAERRRPLLPGRLAIKLGEALRPVPPGQVDAGLLLS